MIQKIFMLLFLFVIGFVNAQNNKSKKEKIKIQQVVISDSIKSLVLKDTIVVDTLSIWKVYKETARASYYTDKFNGRRTASGKIFNMNKLSVAHKKLPFGTMLRVTDINSGKSVIVEVTDRGPFVKSREIDLSKRAFMDIANNKGGGLITVKIEIKDYLPVPQKNLNN